MIGEIMEEILRAQRWQEALDDVKRSMEDKVAQKKEKRQGGQFLCKEYYSYRGNSVPARYVQNFERFWTAVSAPKDALSGFECGVA